MLVDPKLQGAAQFSKMVRHLHEIAGGAVLTMLADTMMPEAFDKAGPLVGLFTTAGFSVAFALHLIE